MGNKPNHHKETKQIEKMQAMSSNLNHKLLIIDYFLKKSKVTITFPKPLCMIITEYCAEYLSSDRNCIQEKWKDKEVMEFISKDRVWIGDYYGSQCY